MASPQADPAPIRILLVEDDEDDHILIRDTLEEMGTPTCFLEWARTYEAGLQLIHEHRHDLYVFDYRLGAHTGIDLLPAGHPFSNVQSSVYWSATTFATDPTFAWLVAFDDGLVSAGSKTSGFVVWCVRGGHNDGSQY